MEIGKPNQGKVILEHLSFHLGREISITKYPDLGIFIATYSSQPCEGATTFVTIGLSKHVLTTRSGGKVAEELIFSCWDQFLAQDPKMLLGFICAELLRTHRAIERGQTFGTLNDLWPLPTKEALYCTWPLYFSESIEKLVTPKLTINFLQLFPISKMEAMTISSEGWEAFENLLERYEPELLDLNRPSLT